MVDSQYLPRVNGAIDLGALSGPSGPTAGASTAAGAPGAPGAPGAGATHNGALIVELTEQIIGATVELSRSVPVLAIVISERSPESQQMALELQKLAHARGGAFQLALVNGDAHPQIAQALGAQTIPFTLGILGGRPLPISDQVLDANTLATAVDQLLQAGAQTGITGRLSGEAGETVEPELPPLHQKAIDALESGDLATARAAYEQALKEAPADQMAKEALNQIAVLERAEAAKDSDPAQVLAAAESAGPTDVKAALAAADVELLAGDPPAAFARLLATIRATAGDEREEVRLRLLQLFDVVGQADPAVAQARRQLASALF